MSYQWQRWMEIGKKRKGHKIRVILKKIREGLKAVQIEIGTELLVDLW
jgi:hypothetical protein